jgi:hypothetical protein
MPCDRNLKKGQTIQQRAEEVRRVASVAAAGLASGRIKVKVGQQGAVAFVGLSDDERDGVTDGCLYRRLLASGSASALQAVARAEALAGRPVDRQLVAQGAHSHDDGNSWHYHKG